MYLFGFGSLINIKSAQNSFKNRKLTQKDLIPVKIKGYKRVWNSIESIKFEDEQINGIFLNIQKDVNATMYGIMIKISQEEFEVLKLREKNYSCIKIDKENVLNQNIEEDLIAFMTINEDKIAQKGYFNSYIPSKYIEIIQDGLLYYDEDFNEDFKKILENFPFELKIGDYTFTDPIQNQAAKRG